MEEEKIIWSVFLPLSKGGLNLGHIAINNISFGYGDSCRNIISYGHIDYGIMVDSQVIETVE